MRSIVLPDDFIVPASAPWPPRGCGRAGAHADHTMEQTMKLTDTQLVLLSRASQRPDQCAEIPANLKGGARPEVRCETPGRRPRRGDPGGDRHAGLAQRR